MQSTASLITNKVCLGKCECHCTPFFSRPVLSVISLKICFSSKYISKEQYWTIQNILNLQHFSIVELYVTLLLFQLLYQNLFCFYLRVIICKNHIMLSPICCLVCYRGSKISINEFFNLWCIMPYGNIFILTKLKEALTANYAKYLFWIMWLKFLKNILEGMFQ